MNGLCWVAKCTLQVDIVHGVNAGYLLCTLGWGVWCRPYPWFMVHKRFPLLISFFLFYSHFFLWYHILFFHFPFLTFLFYVSLTHVWFLLIDPSLDRLVCHHPLSLSPWSLARGSSGAVVWIVGSWISYTFDTVEDAFYRKPEIFYGEEKLLLSNYVSFLGLALHFR